MALPKTLHGFGNAFAGAGLINEGMRINGWVGPGLIGQ